MNLYLCLASVNPERFAQAVQFANEHATGRLSLLSVGNGCDLTSAFDRTTLDHLERVISTTRPTNEGVPRANHLIWEMARSLPSSPNDVLCYIHDDLIIHESGWDQRVHDIFQRDTRCGLVGFGGATSYGTPDIYRSPYALHQMNRQDFWSNMDAAETHGKRTTVNRPIVYADGYALLIKRELLDKIGGWAGFPFVHHGYDTFIACQARRHGYTTWLAPVNISHGEGGWGAGSRKHPRYTALVDPQGGDVAVHAAAHKWLYTEFKDVLPLKLP